MVFLLFIIGIALLGAIITLYRVKVPGKVAWPTLMRQSVFTVREGNVTGSGFFVTESGYGVSSATIFLNDTDQKTQAIMPVTGKTVEVRITSIDITRDVAILEFPVGKYGAMKLGNEASAVPGDEVYIFKPDAVVGTIGGGAQGSLVIQTSTALGDNAVGGAIGHKNSKTVIGMVGQRMPGQDQKLRSFVRSTDIAAAFQAVAGSNLLEQKR